MCFVFFFCKQKTAYELRSSDWSSDVCSSDLHPHVGFKVVLDAYIAIDAATQATGNEILLLAGNHDLPRNLEVVGAFEMLEALLDGHPKVTTEIGRASCRERVCQYV